MRTLSTLLPFVRLTENVILFQCFVGVWILFTPILTSANVEGDLELLKVTAMAHKDNLARIQSWQGKASIKAIWSDENGIYRKETRSAVFLFSRDHRATRWSTSVEERKYRNEKGDLIASKMNLDLEHFNEMKKGNAFYRYAHYYKTKTGEDRDGLTIMPLQESTKLMYSDRFDPMWYFTNKGYDVVKERLLFCYREAKNLDLSRPVKVWREGNLVILESNRKTPFKLINRHTFDLSKGGNLIEYYGEHDDPSKKVTELREWTFEQKDGAWIPKSFTMNIKNKKGDNAIKSRSRKISFSENNVNIPVDPSEFTLEKLGVKIGDPVTDNILKLSYRYNGKVEVKLPDDTILQKTGEEPIDKINASDSSEAGLNYKLWIAILSISLLLILLCVLIYRKSKMKSKWVDG